jgi:hypothetical protein
VRVEAARAHRFITPNGASAGVLADRKTALARRGFGGETALAGSEVRVKCCPRASDAPERIVQPVIRRADNPFA